MSPTKREIIDVIMKEGGLTGIGRPRNVVINAVKTALADTTGLREDDKKRGPETDFGRDRTRVTLMNMRLGLESKGRTYSKLRNLGITGETITRASSVLLGDEET